MMKLRACVIGSPISHSLSPVIHNYWLKKYGIEGEYVAIEVKPDRLEAFLKDLDKAGFKGCNITVPHKEAAWQIISKMNEESDADSGSQTLPDHVAYYMRAINTVVVSKGGLVGTNTDFVGFARNLLDRQPNYDYKNSIAYIIGAGGAAKAVAFALASMNVKQIVITNRTIERSFEIKDMMVKSFGYPEERFDVIPWEKRNDVFANCNIVVNATSLGMKGSEELDINFKGLLKDSLVTDIVYNPLETNFLKKAKAAGAITVDGLGMLLHQAAPGFEAWFGKKPTVDEDLRIEVLKHLKNK
jgi:shikimate dehydrogenase